MSNKSFHSLFSMAFHLRSSRTEWTPAERRENNSWPNPNYSSLYVTALYRRSQKTPKVQKPYCIHKLQSYSEVSAWKLPNISKSCIKFPAGWKAKQSKPRCGCISSFLLLLLSSCFHAYGASGSLESSNAIHSNHSHYFLTGTNVAWGKAGYSISTYTVLATA